MKPSAAAAASRCRQGSGEPCSSGVSQRSCETSAVGDFFYGDLRWPFTQAGMWGRLRVLSDPRCPLKPLDGRDCLGRPSERR